MLIVGGNDPEVLDLNREALEALGREKELRVVPGASHLFGEPGALDQVARLARLWFERHLLVRRFRDRDEAGRVLAAHLGSQPLKSWGLLSELARIKPRPA